MRGSLVLAGSLLLIGASIPAFADDDAEGCKDVNFSRMANFHIRDCDDKDFDAFTFGEAFDAPHRVEGHIVQNNYSVNEGAKAPSALAVLRNYESAAQRAGWTLVKDNETDAVWSRKKNGKEQWAQLDYNGGGGYHLVFGEPAALEQSVTTADDMLSALNSEGHVALQINFDTGKATIKPDSQAIVDQIVALLKDNKDLKLSVEGHTDNVGDAKANKALSEARAKAVVAALTQKGIAASRLKAVGFGQEKPVADNSTDEGRAKNRRVELVKM
jgi:outer membrane protein OmpA-like peptidoglycan-associated protein